MEERKNVNSARNELLIIMEYLLNETDEEHLSKVKDIMDYALKNYGIEIHKTRVSECLRYLKELNDKYPDNFPFVLYESVGLKNKKYFIEQRQFSLEDIYYICSAIKNDKYTGKNESNRLINAVLNVTTNKYNDFKIRVALDKKFKKVAHYSEKVTKNVRILDLAKVEKNVVLFDTFLKENAYFGNKPVVEFARPISHEGYVYDVVDYDKGPVLIFIDLETKKLEKYDVKDIKNLKVLENFRTKKANEKFDVATFFESDKYKSPDEELNDITMPEKGSQKCIAQFSFEAKPEYIEIISESFKNFFGKDLDYKIEIKNEKEFACCSLSTNAITFLKWATNFNIILLIKITGDETLKEFYRKYLNIVEANIFESVTIE